MKSSVPPKKRDTFFILLLVISMRVREIQDIIEKWAPREIAWENDNVGLQLGDSEKSIKKILVALEISPEIVTEARRKRIDLIITHHPLLFNPLRTITESTDSGRLVRELIQSSIGVYSAHTNLDFTRGGVSFVLADRLGLNQITFLQKASGAMKKVSVFVPPEHVDAVADAMASAGAGIIGDYEKCSFRTVGTGTFQPQKGAKPFLGSVGNLEKAQEVRLEMLVPNWRLPAVIKKMIGAHPYEEVAYDVYPLENQPADYGAGTIGDLDAPLSLRAFLGRVKEVLKVRHVRFCGDPTSRVRRVAVCGGSGSSLLHAAIETRADVFVTADVKYHTFQEARGKISLVDAGHYETELPVLNAVVERLRKAIKERGDKVQIVLTSTVTNPIFYH